MGEERGESVTEEMKHKLYINIGMEVNASFVPTGSVEVQVQLKVMLSDSLYWRNLNYADHFK